MSRDRPGALAREILSSVDAAERRRLLRQARSCPEVTRALKLLADDLLRSDAREALRIAHIARAAGVASGDPEALAVGVHSLAKALHAANRYADAAKLYASAAERYGRLGLRHERALVRLARVGALSHLGRFTEAEQEARPARRELLRLGDAVGAAKVLLNLANVRHAQDRHLEAIRLLRRARQPLVAGGERAIVANVDLNLANSYSQLARFDRSEKCYREAQASFRELGLDELVARVDYNLAYDRFLQGRLQEARLLLDSARVAFRRVGARHVLALAARDEAEMALMVNRSALAFDAAAEAKAVFQAEGAPVEAARAALLEGLAAIRLGRHEHGETVLVEARNAFAAATHTVGRAAADLALAASSGQPQRERRRRAVAAAKAFRRNGLVGKETAALVVAGTLEMELGRPGRSRDYLKQALLVARRRGLPEIELRAEHALGALEQDAGHAGRAFSRYLRAVGAYERLRTGIRSDSDRLAFATDKTVLFEDACATALDLGRIDQAFSLIERSRSRALVDLLASDARFTDATLTTAGDVGRRTARLERELRLRESRARDGERRRVERPGVGPRSLAGLRTELEAALAELARKRPDVSYAIAGRPIAHLQEVRSRLGSERALLTYFVERGQLGALVVTDGEIKARRGLCSMDEVDRAMAHLRLAFARRSDSRRQVVHSTVLQQAAEAALVRVGQLLLDREVLAAVGDRALVVVPCSGLHVVPFHALMPRGAPLVEQREVSVTPSATVLEQASARVPATTEALVLAIPHATTPAIEHEAEVVARALGGRVVRGDDVTSAALRAAGGRARVIHVAVHGTYDRADALRSGLELADGRFTVTDTAGLSLDAALVTLSACESALGTATGDEYLGLVRAFLRAGARSVVASLWEVSDDSTSVLMQLFYERLARGDNVTSALRDAARELRREYPNPYHWAPFQVVGGWEPVVSRSGAAVARTSVEVKHAASFELANV